MKTFVEFCAGIGGFRLGFESAGWKCVYASDIDLECEKTYENNFGDKFQAYDLTLVDKKSIPDSDLICAGFPCQPFSIAGKCEAMEDPRSNVLSKILEIVAYKKPKFVLLENVANFGVLHKGKYLNLLLTTLNEEGYDVTYETLNAKDFGVPQNRRRVFIFGVRKSLGIPLFNFSAGNSSNIAIRDIIEEGDKSIPISPLWHKYIDLYQGIISADDFDGDLPRTRRSLERSDKNVNLENCIFQIRSSGIRAISIDNQYPTLAVSHSGGGAMIPIYTKERRHLSVTEIRRIMGFPENFNFPISRTNAIKQLSNAVCPPVIKSIANDINLLF